MSLTCLIVDDEYLAIRLLQTYASRIPDLEMKESFKNPKEALEWLRHHPVDLLLLDIQMPYLDGFALLKQLRQPPMVIFTTARHDYAVRAFELDVLDYLVKPISFERFEKAIGRAREQAGYRQLQAQQQSSRDRYLMIRADYKIIRLSLDSIEYIEGLNEYVKIYTQEKVHITLASLKDLSLQLPAEEFARIHKRYITRLSQIVSYGGNGVRLRNGQELPVGRVYKEGFLAVFNKRP